MITECCVGLNTLGNCSAPPGRHINCLQSTVMERTVAILAGGQSRRMGRDKAQLDLGGISLLERTARTSLAAAARVVVIGRERPTDWPLPEVPFVPDDAPGLGPLAGLGTALRHASTWHADGVLALACDMPKMNAAGLSWLFEAAAQRRLDHGLAVVNAGQLEPLFSIYTAECVPLIEDLLATNRRSLHGLIEGGSFQRVEAPPEIATLLVNVNTPEDLGRLTLSPSFKAQTPD